MVAEVLDEVRAPILFIVGGNDTQVLEPNREGPDRLTCEAELHVVEGVGHRFERAGELEVAADWFERTLK